MYQSYNLLLLSRQLSSRFCLFKTGAKCLSFLSKSPQKLVTNLCFLASFYYPRTGGLFFYLIARSQTVLP